MSFTVQNAVDLARDWLNDDAKVRMSDAKGERFFNAVLQAFALIRPDLFTILGALTPTAGNFHQQLNAVDTNVITLFNILSVVNGNVIYECELGELLAVVPGAIYETAGVPVCWGRDPSDKNAQSALRYWLYPRPASGQVLAQYAMAPAYRTLAQTVLADSTLALSESWRFPLAKGIQYCAETMDDEYVTTGRAQEGLKQFMEIAIQSKETKKTEVQR